MVIVFAMADLKDKGSRVKQLLLTLSVSWGYPAGDLTNIYEKLAKEAP